MVNGQERKQKREFHGEKGMAALFLMDRRNKRRRRRNIRASLLMDVVIPVIEIFRWQDR